MPKQSLYLGGAANDGTGDTLRQAGQKINDNFDELYSLTLIALNGGDGSMSFDSGFEEFTLNLLAEGQYVDENRLVDAISTSELGMRSYVDSELNGAFDLGSQFWVDLQSNLTISSPDLSYVDSALAAINLRLDTLISVDSDGQIVGVTTEAFDSAVASLRSYDSDLNQTLEGTINILNGVYGQINDSDGVFSSLAGRVTSLENGVTAEINSDTVALITSNVQEELVSLITVDSSHISALNQSITDLSNSIQFQDSDSIINATSSARQELFDTITIKDSASVVSISSGLIQDFEATLDIPSNEDIVAATATARDELRSDILYNESDGVTTLISSSETALRAEFDSDILEAKQSLQVQIDSAGNTTATYALVTNVNNHIAGINLENDGGTADFVVTTNNFKITNSSDASITPFIIEGDQVKLSNIQVDYADITGATIDSAQIQTVAITTAQIANATAASINVSSSDATGSMTITDNLITISDATGPRVRLGKIA